MDARGKDVLPTALQLRFVAVRRIKQVYAAPTDPWRPLVVKLLAHDRAEPLQEGAPLDAALQAWETPRQRQECTPIACRSYVYVSGGGSQCRPCTVGRQ